MFEERICHRPLELISGDSLFLGERGTRKALSLSFLVLVLPDQESPRPRTHLSSPGESIVIFAREHWSALQSESPKSMHLIIIDPSPHLTRQYHEHHERNSPHIAKERKGNTPRGQAQARELHNAVGPNSRKGKWRKIGNVAKLQFAHLGKVSSIL
jgi:hypothetical protein